MQEDKTNPINPAQVTEQLVFFFNFHFWFSSCSVFSKRKQWDPEELLIAQVKASFITRVNFIGIWGTWVINALCAILICDKVQEYNTEQ